MNALGQAGVNFKDLDVTTETLMPDSTNPALKISIP
jgi:hypothetical protein